MKKFFALLLFVFSLLPASHAAVVSEPGAWCWFADPRAVHNESVDGRTNFTYVGMIDNLGNIKALQYDFNSSRWTTVLVRSYFQPDDHDNPTFLVLPDRRVMVFYSRHTDEPCFYYRITDHSGDLRTLGPENVIPTDHNTTYPSPFYLADDPGHFYLCWRGINWHPTIARLTIPDSGGKVAIDKGPYQIVQSTGARPYAKYTSDGKSRIMLAYTTGHPDNEDPNLLYYNYIDVPSFGLFDVTGRRVASVDQAPLRMGKDADFVSAHPDMVVDKTPYRDWVWQIAIDRQGIPVIAHTRISKDKKSHNYYVSRWDGSAWRASHIAFGGGHFHQSPDIELCYSGGMALDCADPRIVYCSVPIDGVYEIVKYRTDPAGLITSAEAVTRGSAHSNSRPYLVKSGTPDTPDCLMWMAGEYFDWIVSEKRPRGYDTRIVMDAACFPCHKAPAATARVCRPYRFDPAEDFTITERIARIAPDKAGVFFDLGPLKLAIDTASLVAETRYKGRSHRAANPLADASQWRSRQRSTNGKWYPPTPLRDFRLTLEYADGMLSVYIDDMLYQHLRLEPSRKKPAVFTVDKPDFKRSPFTGMTRRHWLQAAEYLLQKPFADKTDIGLPMAFDKQLEKTYPRAAADTSVAYLEGLARTLFIAAPLLRDDPGKCIGGVRLADYYLHHLRLLTDPASLYRIPPRPSRPSQTLLELGSICMALEIAKDALWLPLGKDERDSLAMLMKSYGEGPTIGSNWRFFNVFALSFLKKNGYEVNDEYLRTNLTELLGMYRGEGWYNDAPAYDYYSQWAFQTYGPLWVELFGKEMEPQIAAQFTANQRDMIDNYPYMFARDGRMNMWGRSIPYRFACTAPFGILEFAGHEGVNYGWLRRISSGALLQFLQHPEYMDDGVPAMGFYGPFAPSVQIYSCRGSVYWQGKAFFSLLLPEDSQYWSAVENEGPWAGELKPGKVYNKFQSATSLLITDYPDIGGAEMRSWCKEKAAKDWQRFRSSENYNKLAYHTEFPWMADGPGGEVSMNYAVKNRRGDWEVLRLYDFASFSDGVYRRDAVLESDPDVYFQLADIPLPGGTLRVDKITCPYPTTVTLGTYALPRLATEIKTREAGSGTAFTNGQYTLAGIPLHGFQSSGAVAAYGLHPQSPECTLVMHRAQIQGSAVLISYQAWKKGSKPFSRKELNVVSNVEIAPDLSQVTVTLADGEVKTVEFK